MRYDVDKIIRRRLEKGWTQTRLAEEVGVSAPAISKLERVGSARPDTVKVIAKALGLSMKDLVIEDEPEEARA